MYEETLEMLGLSPNEAKIYKALLELKNANIWNISTHAQIHRRNTYDAIQRLMNKGLAYQILPKKTLTYAPVHPEKLREIVEEKQKELESVMPGLVRRFSEINIEQTIYVYKGIGGLKNFIDLIIREKRDIYGIGSKGTWFDPRIRNFATRAQKKYIKAGITSHLIYDQNLEGHPEVIKIVGGNKKFLPQKYCGGSSVDIFGDYVAIYSGVGVKSLEQDITIFILKDKTLAKDYMRWWHFIWDMLP